MSKSEINPEELLEDISKVFSIINKLEDTDNIEKININKLTKQTKKLEKEIKEKYSDNLDIKK
jgi:4-diphosphocytidyl-2C-methyl-D-erythritol kinase